MEYNLYDLAAVEDWLLTQLAGIRNYRKYCDQSLEDHDGKSGTARMERYKTILMADFLKYQLAEVQNLKKEL